MFRQRQGQPRAATMAALAILAFSLTAASAGAAPVEDARANASCLFSVSAPVLNALTVKGSVSIACAPSYAALVMVACIEVSPNALAWTRIGCGHFAGMNAASGSATASAPCIPGANYYRVTATAHGASGTGTDPFIGTTGGPRVILACPIG